MKQLLQRSEETLKLNRTIEKRSCPPAVVLMCTVLRGGGFIKGHLYKYM